jgi:hypothetical protein
MKLFVLCLCVLVSACIRPPVNTSQSNNPAFQLDKLFTHDGCTVYRFEDAAHYHYFTDCAGSVSTQQWCGKSCTYDDTVETVRPPR